MSEEPEKKHKHLLVYLGARTVGRGAAHRAFCWALLKEPGALLPDRYDDKQFGKPLQKRATPGSVWRLDGNESASSLYVESGEYVGRYADEQAVATWQVEHRAAEAEHALTKKAAAELRQKLDMEALEPFRLAYGRMHGVRRGLLIASMVHYVTKGTF